MQTMIEVEAVPLLKRGNLIQVDRALQSWRDAGFDLSAGAGEVVDNSIQAGAREVRIATFEVGAEGGKRSKQSVESIAFADNGAGIPTDILPNVLTMGFSTRYGERNGLGRFGVGAKLAALSQSRRADIYTRHIGSGQVYHTFFDLDMINGGEQEFLEALPAEDFPAKYAHLMRDEKGNEYQSGTLVIWSKVDRLEEGGRFGSKVDDRKNDLIKFLARTYRRFISNGFRIFMNSTEITLHDPLFLLESPRAVKLLGKDEWQATVVDTAKIDIEGHDVEITITLLPKRVRLVRGEGGAYRGAEPFKDLHIPENQGRVSILRHGREIYYDIVPRLLPGGVEWFDRFIGIEVAFPPALDEYFQVRHVKRGAEPVDKLRDEIRKFLAKPIKKAREDIQATWRETEARNIQEGTSSQHEEAVEAFKKMEENAPVGIGSNVPPEQAETVLETAAQDLGGDTPEQIEKLKEQVRSETLTVIDGDWPGKELFELQHLNGKVIVRLNWRHPFLKQVCLPLKELADGGMPQATTVDVQQLASRVKQAIFLLLFSYAKAENQHPDPDERYSDLRGYWGKFVADGVKNLR